MSDEQLDTKQDIFERLQILGPGRQLPIRDDDGDGGLYFSGDIPRSKPLTTWHDHVKSNLAPSRRSFAPSPSEVAEATFFDHTERMTTDAMTERIIPTDYSSPGARAAGVTSFVDRFLVASPHTVQSIWRDGLAAINQWCRDNFGGDFHALTETDQDNVLTEISRNEYAPLSAEEKFFVVIKRMTWDVYYRTEIGIHFELHYRGNSHQRDFEGCNHPEHL